MLGDALRLSPLHDDRRRDGWSRQKPSPKSLLLCYINSWLINGRLLSGPLKKLQLWLDIYVLILLEIHLLDLDGNHKGCNCSLIWLHLFWLLSRRNTKKTIN